MRRRQIFAAQSVALNNPVTHFEKESHREKVQETSEAAEEVLNVKACPKCGKIMARGLTMHMKYCKG